MFCNVIVVKLTAIHTEKHEYISAGGGVRIINKACIPTIRLEAFLVEIFEHFMMARDLSQKSSPICPGWGGLNSTQVFIQPP